MELAEGFIEGAGEGAWDMLADMANFGMDAFWNPIGAISGMIDGMGALVDQLSQGDLLGLLETMYPDIYKLVTKWDTLSDHDKGSLIGKIAAEEGLPALLGAGGGKLVAKLKKMRKAGKGTLDNVPTKTQSKSKKKSDDEVEVDSDGYPTKTRDGKKYVLKPSEKNPEVRRWHRADSDKNGVRWTTTERRAAWIAKGYPDGKGPRRMVIVRHKKSGELEGIIQTKELHHIDPRHQGGSNQPDNLMEVWPEKHDAIDPHRHTGYEIVGVFDNIQL